MSPVIAIIGPSACGKSSVARELHRRGTVRVHPTWTTRPRRADEHEGTVEHRFVSEATFDQLCVQRFFLATATPFGLPWRYGLAPLPPPSAERIDLVMLRAPQVEGVRAHVRLSRIYQIEDEPSRIQQRLVERGTSPPEIEARLDDNRNEVLAGREITHATFLNDGSIDELANRLAVAISADVASPAPSTARADPPVPPPGPPRAWASPKPTALAQVAPPGSRQRFVLNAIGIVLAIIVGMAGLFMMTLFFMLYTGSANLMSNK